MRDEISLGITKANIKKSNASIIFLKNFIRIPTAVFGSIFVFCTFYIIFSEMEGSPGYIVGCVGIIALSAMLY